MFNHIKSRQHDPLLITDYQIFVEACTGQVQDTCTYLGVSTWDTQWYICRNIENTTLSCSKICRLLYLVLEKTIGIIGYLR